MNLPLEGRRIALAESRQLNELAAMLSREGGIPVPCPLVSIVDAEDPAPVVAWIHDVVAGKFAYVVFMTGEGVRRLVEFAEQDGSREPWIAALARTKIVTRGPKPVKALREIGLSPTLVASAPTSEGIAATLATEPLSGAKIGVQFHGELNQQLLDFIHRAGAATAVVQPYRYAPASDAERVADLIQQMHRGEIDLIIFTSTPQVQRLHEVASERGMLDALNEGMATTCVAAIGPVAADSLREHGCRVDIMPEQGFVMKNLVQYVKRELDQRRPRR